MRAYNPEAWEPGVCRVCGCTERDACVSPRGRPCGWAAGSGRTLCTSCAGVASPATPEGWQRVAELAAAVLQAHAGDAGPGAARALAFNAPRARRLLAICAARGFVPGAMAATGGVEDYAAALFVRGNADDPLRLSRRIGLGERPLVP